MFIASVTTHIALRTERNVFVTTGYKHFASNEAKTHAAEASTVAEASTAAEASTVAEAPRPKRETLGGGGEFD
jgi:hypothetical protein